MAADQQSYPFKLAGGTLPCQRYFQAFVRCVCASQYMFCSKRAHTGSLGHPVATCSDPPTTFTQLLVANKTQQGDSVQSIIPVGDASRQGYGGCSLLDPFLLFGRAAATESCSRCVQDFHYCSNQEGKGRFDSIISKPPLLILKTTSRSRSYVHCSLL